MQIAKDTVVSFHYCLSEEGGAQLEDSRTGEPVLYLHGHNSIMPGLEQALADKQAGDQVSVTLAPEQAYGLREEGAQMRVPIKHLLTKGRIQPGMIVQINTEHGAREAQVIKVGKFNVDVDSNHPLAGKTLTFAIEVLEVRPATAEELAHGHAHGVGGHHH